MKKIEMSVFFDKIKGKFGKKKTDADADGKKKIPLPVVKIGPDRKLIGVLWGVLIISVVFGTYKNFTAADTETIYEREVVETEIRDTNAVEAFVTDFARVYHAWGNSEEDIAERKEAIAGYLTDALVKVSADMVTTDCPTQAAVEYIDILEVEETADGEYNVWYSVTVEITENDE